MKPEGAVRQKLKQVRFRHAKRELDAALTRTSSTCGHNAAYDVPGVGEVGVCLLNQGVVCDAGRGADLAPGCASYLCKNTRDGMKGVLEAVFDGSIAEVAAKYPDAAALMWVLTEENPTEATPEPILDPFGENMVLAGTFFDVPVWTHTPAEGETFAKSLNDLMEKESRMGADLALREGENQALRNELESVHAGVNSVRTEFTLAKSALAALESELKGRVHELEDALRRVTEERDTLQAKLDLPLWSPSRWAR